MDYKAVIFDFDYTLGDATDAIYAGFRAGMTALGQPVPDGTSAAAELSAYVDDEFFYLHNSIGFKRVVYGICALE